MSSSRQNEDGGGSARNNNNNNNKRGEGRRKKNQLPDFEDIGETPLRGQEKRLFHDDGATGRVGGSEGPSFRSAAIQLMDPSAQLHHPYGRSGGGGEELKIAGINVKHQQQQETFIQPSSSSATTTTADAPSWTNHPSLQNLTRQRWNTGGWENSCEYVQPFPMYFPRDNFYDFDAVTLPDVQERLATFFFRHGIQASLKTEPCLSATLETCEGDELYLTFFHDPAAKSSGSSSKSRAGRERGQQQQPSAFSETDKIYIDVQRKKGDHMRLCQYIFKIVESAKGVGPDADDDIDESEGGDAMMTDAPIPDPSSLQAVENLIQRAAADNGASITESGMTSQEEYTKSILKQADEWITAPQLGLHRKAVECLLVITDLRQSTSSAAVASALAILQGAAPSVDLSQQTQTIQRSVLTILQNRELPGDRALLPEPSPSATSSSNTNTKNDADMLPYFEDNSFVPSSDLPSYYVTYMNEMFHMTLQVLVQSLEVVACFHQQLSSLDVQELARNLLVAASNVAGGKDLYETLLGCVKSAESKLANGYLACKALRLLAMALPSLKDRLKGDDKACSYIGGAIQVGYTSHQLLHVESERLWQTVCSS
mmetsp:Transcript_22707/g.53780  ORF Transcript_22707/g.53780 Transcript_22707/m.53780 type:complete len:599 (-) Transcript_22707:150-1946(-)